MSEIFTIEEVLEAILQSGMKLKLEKSKFEHTSYRKMEYKPILRKLKLFRSFPNRRM
ncbi:Transposase [Caenorhabditis elegans]|uniref:Transposase n=1 Tax=Caenorhabditis elegans TaxID=6239 RepID=A0A168H214_CAEEL|nr:Transposase [Caenorhabditis elegans]SAP35532.1 Transposase [Caenorhabditis elegans]|eukprot:NP_001317777.1 Uncharacterized protein CELE_T16A1.10 [Caenorhabditis elegans]